jgi:hypothetical protein
MRFLLPRGRSRAPLAIAAFIAIPLFFSSLMAATLALEKPHVIAWKGGKHGLLMTWHEPTSRNIAAIWLWALVPPLLLILVGLISVRLPYGFYVPCVAAIVIALAVVHDIDKWTRHHTMRFPVGVDLIPSSNAASNKFDRGQWEHMARDTALSLSHWTIAIALASGLAMAGLTVRRRYFARRPGPMLEEPPLEGLHAPDATTPGLGDPSVR